MAGRAMPLWRYRHDGAYLSSTLSALLMLLLLSPMILPPHYLLVSAAVECNKTATCERLLRPGSECVNGMCTNPFAAGCLRNYLGEDVFPAKRICNSHDDSSDSDNDSAVVDCEEPTFDYTELRILAQDWDSSLLSAWVMQIFLSEVVRVPVSLETSSPDISFNFYDPQNAFAYGAKPYDYDALRMALQVSDCRKINNRDMKSKEEYRSCAHVMPEVWSGQRATYLQAEEEELIEPAEGAGGVAKYSWYVPKFVAEQDHTLLSHFGLTGPEGRLKLAQTFKRPTTWKDYCDRVSLNNCTTTNVTTAVRAPLNEEEGEQYFVEGLYHGYFRATEENDCEQNPTCTGHITNVICSWSTFVVPQAYHNDIAVKSNGPEVNGGYPFLRMLEIYRAANYSKSPVLFYWFAPDPMFQSFIGTDAEMQKVLLPLPSQACSNSRTNQDERCSLDQVQQVGSPLGACDFESHIYKKLVVANLFHDTMAVPIEQRSPAYDAIKRFRISDLEVAQLFDYWNERNVDRYGFDPHHAVCRWVAENLDALQRFVPRTYPREIVMVAALTSLHYIAMALGILAALLVVATAVCVYKYRERRILKYAQVEFVLMLLVGLLLISVGGVLVASEPSHASCVAVTWLILMGYTLELVPLIFKVAAINKLMSASRRMKRVRLQKGTLFGGVFIIMVLVAVYLLVWMVLDPWTKQEELHLSDERENVVEVGFYCGSSSEVWVYIGCAWQVLLLISATVLAIQTRNVMTEFNESRRLGIMVYSHFIFVLLRVVVLLLQEEVAASTLAGCLSLIYSTDTLATLCIYFVPKLVGIWKGNRNSSRGGHVMMMVSASAYIDRARKLAVGNAIGSRSPPHNAQTGATTTGQLSPTTEPLPAVQESSEPLSVQTSQPPMWASAPATAQTLSDAEI